MSGLPQAQFLFIFSFIWAILYCFFAGMAIIVVPVEDWVLWLLLVATLKKSDSLPFPGFIVMFGLL